MKQLTIENFKAMLDNALKNIKEREDEFSKLDAVIGDGDHGQAIVTAMSAIVATAQKGTEFKAMLNDMGFDVMLQVSGSTSTLLGAFFLGMSDTEIGDRLKINRSTSFRSRKNSLEEIKKKLKENMNDE